MVSCRGRQQPLPYHKHMFHNEDQVLLLFFVILAFILFTFIPFRNVFIHTFYVFLLRFFNSYSFMNIFIVNCFVYLPQLKSTLVELLLF